MQIIKFQPLVFLTEYRGSKADGFGQVFQRRPEVLHDINFEIEQGSFHFLTGSSGAGKTSLMKLLYIAQRPTRGIVTLFGRDLSTMPRRALPELRRQIGIVFQDFRLLAHLSAFANVAFPLRAAGVTEKDIRRNVAEMLD